LGNTAASTSRWWRSTCRAGRCYRKPQVL
jgi:hypothetical protein